MAFHMQQPGSTTQKSTSTAKPQQELLDKDEKKALDAEEAVDTSEWSDEDEADIHLAEKEDDPDAKEDVKDKKLKSAKPAKQE